MRREHNIITETPVLPSGYTPLEYIESTGTQYINTGLTASNGFDFDLNFMFTQAQGNAYIVGSHNISAPYGRNGVQSAAYIYNSLWGIGSGDNQYVSHPGSNPDYVGNTILQYSVNTKYHIVGSTVKGATNLYVDGSLVFNSTNNTIRSSNNLLFFVEQYTLNRGQAKTKGRLYGNAVLIIDGGQYVFIPCKRDSDNKPGLYNLTTLEFKTNAGTGEFLYA